MGENRAAAPRYEKARLMMPPGSSFAAAERTSAPLPKGGRAKGGFGPALPPFAPLALRARNAFAAPDAPKRSSDNACWCKELLASHSGSRDHRGKS
jgi:hypothetical protein